MIVLLGLYALGQQCDHTTGNKMSSLQLNIEVSILSKPITWEMAVKKV